MFWFNTAVTKWIRVQDSLWFLHLGFCLTFKMRQKHSPNGWCVLRITQWEIHFGNVVILLRKCRSFRTFIRATRCILNLVSANSISVTCSNVLCNVFLIFFIPWLQSVYFVVSTYLLGLLVQYILQLMLLLDKSCVLYFCSWLSPLIYYRSCYSGDQSMTVRDWYIIIRQRLILHSQDFLRTLASNIVWGNGFRE